MNSGKQTIAHKIIEYDRRLSAMTARYGPILLAFASQRFLFSIFQTQVRHNRNRG